MQIPRVITPPPPFLYPVDSRDSVRAEQVFFLSLFTPFLLTRRLFSHGRPIIGRDKRAEEKTDPSSRRKSELVHRREFFAQIENYTL